MEQKEWRSLTFKCFLLLLSVLTVCVIYSCMTAGRESLNVKAGQGCDKSDMNNVDKNNNGHSELLKSGKVGGKVIVLDAGHGGDDEGAVSFDGKVNEKDYTLLIVKELKDMLDKSDITAYYTRLSDKYVSKKERVKLVNEVDADMMISIHCNASDEWTSTANGAEALFSKRKTGSKKLTNKKLAKLLSDNVSDNVGIRNRGIIQREELYLMHHSKVPTSIIEIGYITDKSDLRYIVSKSGRRKIVQGIYNAIVEAYKFL